MGSEQASCLDESSMVVSQGQQGAPENETVDENESTQKALMIERLSYH